VYLKSDCSGQQIVILTTIWWWQKLGETSSEKTSNAQISYGEVQSEKLNEVEGKEQ
jgi:hypothetical protein